MKGPSRTQILRPSSVFHHKPIIYLPSVQHTPIQRPQQTRSFSNPLTPLQSLSASRILPYHAKPLYNLIADIQSYPEFIPYCQSSSITSQSAPEASTEQRWPRTADLRIGFSGYEELFRSAVYCLPYTVVEAVAGDAEPTIARSQLPHYYEDPEHTHDPDKSAGNGKIFTSLLTRWSLKEFPYKPPPPDGSTPQEGSASDPSSPRCEVNLAIEVRFASAVYSALSQASAPKVAGMMIEAFEKRAAEVLGAEKGPISRSEKEGESGAMEGVTGGKRGIMGSSE